MENKNKKIEYISKTSLLKRGWTEKSITELLPEPQLVENPHYKSAAKMKLWDLKIVEKKEKTKKFKEYAKKKAKRSQVMKKVASKKRKEIIEEAKKFDINVERISMFELKYKTLEAKKNWYDFTEQYDRASSVFGADKETIKRWEINYIRHNLTNYDLELEKLYRKVGKADAYINYKGILMKKIYEVYPELKE